MRTVFLFFLLIILSCKQRPDRRIEVPAESHFVSETILTELEATADQNSDADRLLKQKLYFCEQLEWPARCESILLDASKRWGQSEQLLDRQVAYYLTHQDFQKVLDVLKGQFETESRMQARIAATNALGQSNDELVDELLTKFSSRKSRAFAINILLESGDTTKAIPQFEVLLEEDSSHPVLSKYLPILERENEFKKAIYIIKNQSRDKGLSSDDQVQLARYYFGLAQVDTSRYMLRTLNSPKAYGALVDQFTQEGKFDSALFYLNKNLALDPDNLTIILRKAELLEKRGWVSQSLPLYERAYLGDTTDQELKLHLESVRRKVAYLRRKREKESFIPPPVQRKTGN